MRVDSLPQMTYDLPGGADGAPSSWTLTPALNVRAFAGENLERQRNLGGGSRYVLQLDYDVRRGARLTALQNVLEAAGVPGDDILVRLRSHLGYVPPPNAGATARAEGSAGATTLDVTVAGGTIAAGSIVSIADRLYRVRRDAAVGARTLTLGWPLRADVANGATIEVDDPRARFVVLAEPPSFPVLGRTIAGELYGTLSVELAEAL